MRKSRTTRQPLRVAAFLGIAPMIVATAIAGTAAADPTSDTEATPTPTAVEAPLPADPAPSGGDTSAPPAGKPAPEAPAEAPAQPPQGAPAGTSAGTPAEAPAKEPVEAPNQEPAPAPSTEAEKPKETASSEPSSTPAATPSETPSSTAETTATESPSESTTDTTESSTPTASPSEKAPSEEKKDDDTSSAPSTSEEAKPTESGTSGTPAEVESTETSKAPVSDPETPSTVVTSPEDSTPEEVTPGGDGKDSKPPVGNETKVDIGAIFVPVIISPKINIHVGNTTVTNTEVIQIQDSVIGNDNVVVKKGNRTHNYQEVTIYTPKTHRFFVGYYDERGDFVCTGYYPEEVKTVEQAKVAKGEGKVVKTAPPTKAVTGVNPESGTNYWIPGGVMLVVLVGGVMYLVGSRRNSGGNGPADVPPLSA